jgi:hypothetical protein
VAKFVTALMRNRYSPPYVTVGTVRSKPELRFQSMPDISFLKAGTLDDTQWLAPTMEVYCASAQRWVGLTGGMQRFPQMPG